MINQKRELLIKKLIWQSSTRGCKEMDLIIGGFVKENLLQMTYEEMLTFCDILQLPDTDLYSWYIGEKTPPKNKQNAVLSKLLNFIL